MSKENSYLVICNDGKKYCGTPVEIVCEMRSWDTMCGRVNDNLEYMKLASERCPNVITIDNELGFLRNLQMLGNLTINESN